MRRSEPPVIELDASGKVLKTWGQGMFVWPHGFRIDRDGNLWVTDGRAEGGKGQQVFKLARDGRVLLTLGTKGIGGETPSTFDGPCDVAIGENGAIFVADGHRNNRVVKFTRDGTFVKAWGRKGEGPGEFQTPHAIAIDSRGRLFVANTDARNLVAHAPNLRGDVVRHRVTLVDRRRLGDRVRAVDLPSSTLKSAEARDCARSHPNFLRNRLNAIWPTGILSIPRDVGRHAAKERGGKGFTPLTKKSTRSPSACESVRPPDPDFCGQA